MENVCVCLTERGKKRKCIYVYPLEKYIFTRTLVSVSTHQQQQNTDVHKKQNLPLLYIYDETHMCGVQSKAYIRRRGWQFLSILFIISLAGELEHFFFTALPPAISKNPARRACKCPRLLLATGWIDKRARASLCVWNRQKQKTRTICEGVGRNW